MAHGDGDSDWDVRIGHDELVIRGRYEVISIVNDLLIGLWFIVGSILFFFESTTTAGTWLFLLGSVQLIVRPLIRLHRRVNLSRMGARSAFGGSQDL
ncbi:MAG: YrhK family protein [Ornithinimicrobium sp.]